MLLIPAARAVENDRNAIGDHEVSYGLGCIFARIWSAPFVLTDRSVAECGCGIDARQLNKPFELAAHPCSLKTNFWGLWGRVLLTSCRGHESHE